MTSKELSVNELADELKEYADGVYFCPPSKLLESSIMLRQQQTEIEALKAENKEYEKHIAVGVLMRLRKAQEK